MFGQVFKWYFRSDLIFDCKENITLKTYYEYTIKNYLKSLLIILLYYYTNCVSTSSIVYKTDKFFEKFLIGKWKIHLHKIYVYIHSVTLFYKNIFIYKVK